jgi:hypothetical protein
MAEWRLLVSMSAFRPFCFLSYRRPGRPLGGLVVAVPAVVELLAGHGPPALGGETPEARLVRIEAFTKTPWPEAVQRLRELIWQYQVEYFEMDHGGGGQTVRDLLADPRSTPPGMRPILEQNNPDHLALNGDKILGELFQFAKFDLVQEANVSLKHALECGRLKIARGDVVPGELWTPLHDAQDKQFEDALTEWSNIVTVPSGNRVRWDTPTRSQRKDRYSAIVIGWHAAKKLLDGANLPTSLPFGFCSTYARG